MCFSATASFVASGALVVGSVAIARIPKPRAAIPLSLFPAIFAIHQFIEGLLWLNYGGFLADTYRPAAVYAYLLITFVLWPILVPFSAYVMETGRRRKAIILVCQVAGLYAGLARLLIIIQGPVSASVVGHSFVYTTNTPDIVSALYLVSLSIPFLVSSNKRLVIFGIALIGSLIAAMFIAATGTFASVWCFFAAILSLFLYLFFRYPNNRKSEVSATVASS